MKSKNSRGKITYNKKKSLLYKFNQKGGDCVREGLNHPWSVYPRAYISEYSNYERYRDETTRLIEFMKHLQTEDNIYHLNLIIGSPLEDPQLTDDRGSDEFKNVQWQQMIPHHIQQLFIELNKKPRNSKYIQIVVISPDQFIYDATYQPLFSYKGIYKATTRKTGLLEWSIGLGQSKIKINFFCCPVLSIEQREKFKTMPLEPSVQSTFKISRYIPSDIDIDCIGLFYQLLEQLCEKKISIAINSWAVFRFNEFGFHEKKKNYNMFPELLAIAKKYKLVATEWFWKDYDSNVIQDLVDEKHYIYTRPTFPPRLELPVPSI